MDTITPGAQVLSYDWETHTNSLSLSSYASNYKPAIVLVIRPGNVLADIQFIHSGRIQKGALISMFKPLE